MTRRLWVRHKNSPIMTQQWPQFGIGRWPLCRGFIKRKWVDFIRDWLKVTVMARWPPGRGDREGRFHCTWVFRYGWILGFSSTTRPDERELVIFITPAIIVPSPFWGHPDSKPGPLVGNSAQTLPGRWTIKYKLQINSDVPIIRFIL
jgi:hypothetical protein